MQVFPKGSPLVRDVSRAILNVAEGEEMVEIERKWLGDKSKCSDSNSLLSTRNIGLESFSGLFVLVAIVGVGALTYYSIDFIRENRDIIERSESWSKMWNNLVDKFLGEKTEPSPHGNNQQSPANV